MYHVSIYEEKTEDVEKQRKSKMLHEKRRDLRGGIRGVESSI
jgi:hypothetical protein